MLVIYELHGHLNLTFALEPWVERSGDKENRGWRGGEPPPHPHHWGSFPYRSLFSDGYLGLLLQLTLLGSRWLFTRDLR